MLSVSWVEVRELVAEYLAEWLDLLKQLDLIGELREFAQFIAAPEVDANVLAAVVLYLLPLAWLTRRWRRCSCSPWTAPFQADRPGGEPLGVYIPNTPERCVC